MRPVLGAVPVRGVIVVGEGEKDDAPMLYPGEHIGSGVGPQVDVAVDPVDGAGLTAKSLPNAMALMAVADRGALFDPGHCFYMDKMVVAEDLADVVEFDAPVGANLAAISRRRHVPVTDLTVALLDRPRHAQLVADIQAAGARIKFLIDGDTAGAIMAAQPDSEVDILLGVGGTPAGVLGACAVKCLGGAFFGRLVPKTSAEREQLIGLGYDLDRVLTLAEMIRGGDVHFAATGITDGELLNGVRFTRRALVTQSLAMRAGSGTVRTMTTRHRLPRPTDIGR